MAEFSLLPVITAALLAVAFGNVWYTIMGEPLHESLRATCIRVGAYVLFFAALSQLFVQTRDGELPFFEFGIFVVLISMHHYTYLLTPGASLAKRVATHAGYTVAVTFGGLAVLVYWPW
jgi:hypothetical protein